MGPLRQLWPGAWLQSRMCGVQFGWLGGGGPPPPAMLQAAGRQNEEAGPSQAWVVITPERQVSDFKNTLQRGGGQGFYGMSMRKCQLIKGCDLDSQTTRECRRRQN